MTAAEVILVISPAAKEILEIVKPLPMLWGIQEAPQGTKRKQLERARFQYSRLVCRA